MGSKKERYQLNTSGDITSGSVRARQNSVAVGKYVEHVEAQSLRGTASDARVSPTDAADITAASKTLWDNSLVKAAKEIKHAGTIGTPANKGTPAQSSEKKKKVKASAANVASRYRNQNNPR